MKANISDLAEREALIRLIEKAFDGVERGDGITLHQADVIDEYGSEEEEAEARKLDTEKRWQDIPDDWIQWEAGFNDALVYLDPKSYCYYLPAYMVWAIRHYDLTDYALPEFIIYELDVNYGEQRSSLAVARENWSLLNAEQRSAVAQFLQFMATGQRQDRVDHEAAQKALDEYWHSFLPDQPSSD